MRICTTVITREWLGDDNRKRVGRNIAALLNTTLVIQNRALCLLFHRHHSNTFTLAINNGV